MIKLYFILKNFFKKFFKYLNNAHLIASIKNIGKGNIFEENITIFRPKNLIIGDNNFFGKNLYLVAHGKIEIGSNCGIAADCKFVTRNHIYKDKNTNIDMQSYEYKPIIIGDDC